MKKIITLFVVCCLVNTALAETIVEEWECVDREYTPDWSKILVRARVLKGRTLGIIDVAGITHGARYQVAGFDRRWDFKPDDEESFDYAFIIEPNGDGSYYDFSKESRSAPSIFMTCRQKK